MPEELPRVTGVRVRNAGKIFYFHTAGMRLEAGEYVVPGTPVVTVGDIQNTWPRAYITEGDLGRVKLGQDVVIRTDSYPGKRYHGKGSFIASEAEFTRRQAQTREERVKLVYRVKVDVPNAGTELKPGMPVDAEIDVK